MDVSRVMPELMIERIKGVLPVKVGELLAARVLRIEGELIHLLLTDGTVLKPRLLANLQLHKGEEMVLQVKGAGNGRIELAVIYRQNTAPSAAGSIAGEYRAWVNREEVGIIEKLMENGLPVTKENIREIQIAEKHVSFLLENTELVKGYPLPPEGAVLVDVPIDRIVKWLVRAKEEGASKAVGAAGQQEKLPALKEEMAGIKPEDIIRLIKFGIKLTPRSLVLAKNLRENKGFPGILLKNIYQEAAVKERLPSRTAEEKAQVPVKEGRDAGKTQKSGSEGTKDPGRVWARAEPVNLKVLLKKTVENDKATPRQRAAAELLLERTAFLERALSERNFCVFPFMFDGQVFECIIRAASEHHGGQQTDDALELLVEAEPPNLGVVKVYIRMEDGCVELCFFAMRDDTRYLIEKERETLKKSIEKTGFRISHISCRKMADRRTEAAEKFLDLRV